MNPDIDHEGEQTELSGLAVTPDPGALSLSDLMSALFLLIMALFMVVLVQLKLAQIDAEAAQREAVAAQQESEELKRFLGGKAGGYRLIISQLTRIRDALIEKGILVDIDEETGEMVFRDEAGKGIYFERGSSELTRDSKRFLADFMEVYSDVVLSQRFAEEISWIVIEGNTSLKGKAKGNLTLSLERAEAVANDLLGMKLSEDPAEQARRLERLKQRLVVSGRGQFTAELRVSALKQGLGEEEQAQVEAKEEAEPRDRNVRFRLHFKGNLLEILSDFEAHQAKVKAKPR